MGKPYGPKKDQRKEFPTNTERTSDWGWVDD